MLVKASRTACLTIQLLEIGAWLLISTDAACCFREWRGEMDRRGGGWPVIIVVMCNCFTALNLDS